MYKSKYFFDDAMTFSIVPIGIIHTPYTSEKCGAPFQSVENADGDFFVEIYPEHRKRLDKLETFTYIYLLYWLDRVTKTPKQLVNPTWIKNTKVGLFASRSPNRINPIGLSVVNVKKIKGSGIEISGIDAFDNTPLIDIKPYIKDLDVKLDANSGWLETADADSRRHFQSYIKGIAHDY
jgi:tRNA (adenine37-N6)-methyltransferase